MNKQKFEQLSLNIKAIEDDFENHVRGCKVFSLDCFDTLIWRTVSKPTEVFADLQNHHLWRKYGISSDTRRLAERKARVDMYARHGHREINIHEIYRHIIPGVSELVINDLVDLEIDYEKKYLFAYEPMFKLLERAHACGLRTIVVSDMYILNEHLQEFIKHSANRFKINCEVDNYFVSSQYRKTKSTGLFDIVAAELGVMPNEIVHYGDNMHADLQGARNSGVKGYHFNCSSPVIDDFMEKSASIQKLLLKDHGETLPLQRTTHAALSKIPNLHDPMEAIGAYELGPVLCKFSYWLDREAMEMHANGAKPKLVFMMRDGYLPYLAMKELQSQGVISDAYEIHSIDVSRFATLSMSFTELTAVKNFILNSAGKLSNTEMLRQIFGTHDLSENPIYSEGLDGVPYEEILEKIADGQTFADIRDKANEHKKNFLEYIVGKTDLKRDETLVLVDLGYAGTVQDQITPVIENEAGVKVAGRYLILRDSERAPVAKKGFIDYRDFSVRSVDLLLTQIQTLEQFTVNDSGSLIEYAAGGGVIFEENLIGEAQINSKKIVQQAVLDFVRSSAKDLFKLWNEYDVSLAAEAAGLLGRFTLKPTDSEIAVYTHFSHDINNGTRRTRWISNPFATREMLVRGGGISYDSEYHKMFSNDTSLFDPHMSFANLLQKRVGMKISPNEHIDRLIDLKGVRFDGVEYEQMTIPCFYTHQGYRLALVRGIENIKSCGINFAKSYKWIQFKMICLADIREIFSDPAWQPIKDLDDRADIEGGAIHEKGLVSFSNDEGFLSLNLTGLNQVFSGNHTVAILFRGVIDA